MSETPKPRASQDLSPNLSTVNYFGRVGLKYVIVFLVVLMVGRVMWTALSTYWRKLNPPPPPPPTVGFGILPAPVFPAQSEAALPQEYVLEMAGGLIDQIDRATIFFMPKPVASLLADQKAKEVAAKYGFIFAPEILAEDRYRFTKTQPLDMSLEINPIDLTFSLQSNYLAKPELLMANTNQRLPEEFEAVNRVKNYLGAAALIEPDVATVSGKISYQKSLGGQLSQAYSLSDADFVRVDLNRGQIEGRYSLYTPEGEKGVISAVISSAFSGASSIVELDYNYHRVDYDLSETYPLRGVKAAWKVVQAGDAYVINPQGLRRAVIRSVELAYYDSYIYQEFLQAIYVFKGDNDFMAYVSAVNPSYLESK